MIQRSVPTPGRELVLGERAVARSSPPAAAPPSGKPSIAIRAESGSSQNDRALMRGKAMSGAPIISGVR